MNKKIISGSVIGFLLITAPGAISDWFSLIDRFQGGQPVSISTITWQTIYSTIFPILGLIIIILVILWSRPKIKKNIILQDRQELNSVRGCLLDEITPEKEVWIATWVGTYLVGTGSNIWQSKKITKLILQHPDYNMLKVYEKLDRFGDEQTYKRDIIKTTRLALEANTEVWWYKRPLFDAMIIANPSDRKFNQWVRMEEYLIDTNQSEMPNIMIYEKDYPKFFNNCVNAYNKMISNIQKQSGRPDEIGCLVTQSILNQQLIQLGLIDKTT